MYKFSVDSFPEETLHLDFSNLSRCPSLRSNRNKGITLEASRIESLDTCCLPSHLTHLSISKNFLREGNVQGNALPNVEVLLALCNDFINLDTFLENYFPNLRVLNVSSNKVLETYFLLSLRRLEYLQANSTHIKVLQYLPPPLKVLCVNDSEITIIQSRLPQQLEHLSLSGNSLRYAGLPFNWGTSLRFLDLSHNRIERFPRRLPDTVKHLNLSHNLLTDLPDSLPGCLETCNVSYNNIRKVPSYKRETRIECFLINYNCLTESVGEVTWSNILHHEGNWNASLHHASQRKIRRAWRQSILHIRLRHFVRCRRIYDELLQASMHPSRALQIDLLSSGWRSPLRRS